MDNQVHVGTFIWGAVLAIAGAALMGVGFGWWEMAAIDLRYAAPILVILIGGVILVGAFSQARRNRSEDRPSS